MKEYTITTFKKNWDTKGNDAYCYYWENDERKVDVFPIHYRYFYADIDIVFPIEHYRTVKGFRNVNGKEVNKIIPKNEITPDEYKELQEEYKGKIYESDVKPFDRWMWEEKPKFTKNIRKWYIDIEILRDSNGQYSAVTEAENKVSAITLYDNFCNKYFIFLLSNKNNKLKKDNKSIYIFNKEKDLLKAFLKAVDQLQPDLLTGWNTNGFDIPYLINRMNNLGIESNKLSPLNSVYIKSGNGGSNALKQKYANAFTYFRINIKGRGLLDLMEVCKQFWMGTDVGYSLEAISQKFLGEGKIKIGDIDKCYKEDFWKFVDYNVKDVELCVRLDEEFHLIADMQEFQDVISINLEETPVAGKIINSYIKQHTSIVLTDSFAKEAFDLPGGYVHPVTKGIFKHIKKFDFASHYPSVIRSYNISPDTIVENPTEEEKKDLIHFKCQYQYVSGKGITGWRIVLPGDEVGKDVKEFEVWFRKDRGAITKVVDILTDMRLKHKKEGNKARSTVMKRMINCFSPDHDVMTPEGIKNITDFKVGDLVYSLNPKTQKAEIDKVKRIYEYDYNDEMYEFKNRGCDFLVTPNHNIAYKIHYKCKERGNIKLLNAKEMFSKGAFNLPNNVEMPSKEKEDKIDLLNYFNKEDIELSKDKNSIKFKKENFYFNKNVRNSMPRFYDSKLFFSFLGWYISEGGLHYIKNSNSYLISISQYKSVNKENCNKIEKLLDKLGLDYKNYDNKTYKICNKVLYKFLEKYCGKGSYNKKIPKFCFDYSNDILKELYKSLMLGDGNKDGSRYSTVSKQLANDFLYLCLRIGKVARICYQKDTLSYRIKIRNNNVCSISRKHRTKINYIGKVYCIECENNHIIMAGRDNKLRWIGQSIYGQFGYKYSRFFNDKCAISITLICQYLTRSIISKIENGAIGTAVMGDTDSFAIKLSNDNTVNDVLKCADIVFTYTKAKHNLDKVYSNLELEDEIDKMVLFGVKKKYAELIGDKKIIMGLEMIRKDFPEAIKDFQRNMLEEIFTNDKVGMSDLRRIRKDIEDRIRSKINLNEPEYYSMPTVIRKQIHDYANETAEKKALRNAGLKISINEGFYILPCVGGKDLAFKSKDELSKFDYKPDYERILGKIFGNVKIFEDLFITQTTLGQY